MNERCDSCLVCGCPIEKTAVPSGQDVPFAGKTFPSSFIMISDVIGEVPVEAWQDRVIVEGVTYLNKEINDLKILGLSGTDMRAIHETKKQFEGAIIPERKNFGKVQTLDMNIKDNHKMPPEGGRKFLWKEFKHA